MILDLSVTIEFKKHLKEATDVWQTPPAARAELFQFLSTHERLPVVMKALGQQIQIAEKKFGQKMDAAKRTEIIKASARYFAAVAVTHRTKSNMSQAARILEEHEENKKLNGADLSSLKGEFREVKPDGSPEEGT